MPTITEQELGRISGLTQTGGGVYSGGGKTYTPTTINGVTNYDVKDVASGANVNTPTNSETFNPNVVPNATPEPLLRRLSPSETSALAGNIKPDESAIRADEETQMQSRLNSIAEYYRPQIDAERRAGAQRLARANAALAASGLMGAEGIVSTKRGEQEEITKANVDLIEARKASEIAKVYDLIDQNVKKKYDAQLLENAAEADTAIKRIATEAKSALQTLALNSKGGSYDDLVNLSNSSPEWGDFMKNLKEQSGLTDFELRQLWNQSIPEQYKPIVKTFYTPGSDSSSTVVHYLEFNPKTGKSSEKTYSIAAPYSQFSDEKPIEVDGMLLVKQPDGTYKNMAPTSTGGKFQKIGVDEFGNDKYGFVNESAGKVTEFGATGAGGSTPTTGTVADRTNNPLNIKYSTTTQALGAQDSGIQATDGGTFARFTDPSQGLEAGKQLLQSDIYKDLTVDEAMKKWSNNGYGADVSTISPTKKISELTPDEINQLTTDMSVREGSTKTQAASTRSETYNSFVKDLTPDQKKVLDSLPVKESENVMALINGDVLLSDIAKGMGGAKKADAYVSYAKQIDPNFSENTNKQRYNFKNKWNTDRQYYQTRVSINTALSHMARLNELSKLLENSDISKYNSVANFVAENINTPGIADAVSQFQDTVNLLGTEIARAYKGGVPDAAEIKQQQDSLNASRPANIVQSVLNNKAYLMSSAMKSMSEEYRKVLGKYPDETLVNTNILDEFEKAGLNVDNLIHNFPIGSTFEYQGRMVRKNGQDDYEIVQ